MVALAVTSQATRINDMESLTVGQTIGSIGGGAGAALENTIFYQNSNSIGRKVTDSASPGSGFSATQTTPSDISAGSGAYQTAILKFDVTTSADLDTLANVGLALQIGSDASNYEQYSVEGGDTYPVDKSWRILAIDINIAGYITDSTNGTPTLTAIDYWAIIALFVGGGARDVNVLLDALDVGNGYTVVSGTGADPAIKIQDLVNYDKSILNRYGFAIENDTGPVLLGTHILGNATETRVNSVDEFITFSDGLFAAGWSGLEIGLQHASTTIDFSGGAFLGKGNETITDSRPVVNVVGTSGLHTVTNKPFSNFAEINLNSRCTYAGCQISKSGPVDAGSGATLSTSSILTPTVVADASALIWNTNLDPDGKLDSMPFSKGANAHHAIEFGLTSPLTMTVRGMTATGFNAANGQTDSTFHIKRTTGTVTISIVGGTGNFSYKTDGALVNIVIAPATLSVTAQDQDTKALIQGVVIYIPVGNTGGLPYQEVVTIARSGSTATVSHTGHGMDTNHWVEIDGANQNEYNRAKQITKIDANSYSFQVAGTPTTPATGTITATAVLINGITNASGFISDTRTYTADQAMDGDAIKGDVAPVYKRFPISDTVDSASGKALTILMIPD